MKSDGRGFISTREPNGECARNSTQYLREYCLSVLQDARGRLPDVLGTLWLS